MTREEGCFAFKAGEGKRSTANNTTAKMPSLVTWSLKIFQPRP